MAQPKRLWWRGVSALVSLGVLLLGLQVTTYQITAAPHTRQASSYAAISRADVLARAKSWVTAKVHYSQSVTYQGYHEDCVGFVSMAWGIAAPGMGKTTLVHNYVTPISANELQPGDALLNVDGGGDKELEHIILFAGWVNSKNHQVGYHAYEETPAGAHYDALVPWKYFPTYDPADYQPVRFSGISGSSPSTAQSPPGTNDSSQPAYYANQIVQWNGDTKPQKTAWLVSPDLKRYWIPDSSTFNCLWVRGAAVAKPISATLLNQLPDQTGRSAACGNHTLATNQFLFRGSSLISSNGLYDLELQRSDGNLVLYGPNGTARWSNARSSDYLVLQPDGNLATYSYKGGETWASNTGNTGASQLVVGNDGTLGLYAPGGILKWSSLFASPPVGSTATSTAAPTRQPTATPAPPPGLGTTPGIARQSGTHWEWLLRNSTTGGAANYDFGYAGYNATDIPIAGDWDGNGTVTPGIVRQNGTHWEWLLSNSLTGGAANYDFIYGAIEPGDVPVVGDWDGNGTTTVGIARRNGTHWEWLLRNSNTGGAADDDFIYAGYTSTDRPVVGDWDGNGTTTVGIARQNGTHWEWLLRNSNTGGAATYDFGYAGYYSTDVPVVGDWDGNGTTTIGIARHHGTQWEWLLRNSNSGGIATYDFTYAEYTATDRPVVGNWDGKS